MGWIPTRMLSGSQVLNENRDFAVMKPPLSRKKRMRASTQRRKRHKSHNTFWKKPRAMPGACHFRLIDGNGLGMSDVANHD